MTISRRQVLEVLGSSVVATSAAACSSQETPAANQQPSQPIAAPAKAADELQILFGGLQLFVIEKTRAVVVMPKAATGITPHAAQMIVVGGRVQGKPSKSFTSFPTAFGIQAHAISLDGYRLRITSGTSLKINDDPPKTTAPSDADQWKSMKHIPDFKLLHPKATLLPGWDSTLAQSVVEITAGELMALPGFDKPTAMPEFGGQYFSHFSGLRISAGSTVNLAFESLTNPSQKETFDLGVDTTGPFVGFLAFAPEVSGGMDHGRSIEQLFDPKTLTKTVSVPGGPGAMNPKGAGARGFSLNKTSPAIQFGPLIDMLSDGTPSCPPFSFRP